MSGLSAAGWGALGASSLLLGCVVTLWLRPGPRVVALTMAFGAGALISATAYELVLEAIESSGPVVLGMTTGALTFFVADLVIDRRGGENRKAVDAEHSSAGSGQAIFLGTLLDGVPESFVLGVSIALGGSVSLAFLAAVFVSNLPEAIAATGSMRAAGRESGHIVLIWGWVVLASAVAAAAGYLVVTNVPGVDGAFAQAFAAGAVLTMLADSMMPEAFEHGGPAAGLFTVMGFIVATLISRMD